MSSKKWLEGTYFFSPPKSRNDSNGGGAFIFAGVQIDLGVIEMDSEVDRFKSLSSRFQVVKLDSDAE